MCNGIPREQIHEMQFNNIIKITIPGIKPYGTTENNVVFQRRVIYANTGLRINGTVQLFHLCNALCKRGIQWTVYMKKWYDTDSNSTSWNNELFVTANVITDHGKKTVSHLMYRLASTTYARNAWRLFIVQIGPLVLRFKRGIQRTMKLLNNYGTNSSGTKLKKNKLFVIAKRNHKS